MSDVILNFNEEPSDETICHCEGDLPVPREGETVHLENGEYRVTEVLYDLGSGQIEYPEIWITVLSVDE